MQLPILFRRSTLLASPLMHYASSIVVALIATLGSASAQELTDLSNQPIFSLSTVPGNLVLALSVEFPTAVTAADRSLSYSPSKVYLGYFDAAKCYVYKNEALPGPIAILSPSSEPGYFFPVHTTTTATCTGSLEWSGNFLNWATMQAVDPFRSALTGGYRVIDTPTQTVLEKAYAPTGQGTGADNFPHKYLTSADSAVIRGATPFAGANGFYMHVIQCGNRLVFSNSDLLRYSDTCLAGSLIGTGLTLYAWSDGTVQSLMNSYVPAIFAIPIRVAVCVAGLLESNCKQYGTTYKPEGLIQQYAQKIRYSAFGYLNDSSSSPQRDGGVLRARMKFVGPTQPVPGATPVANVAVSDDPKKGQVTSAEWDATTGVFIPNPDAVDARASSEFLFPIANSGVINYLNQFGLSSKSYKGFDPVSELYYAATRYLRNLENVPSYTSLSTYNDLSNIAGVYNGLLKDGFPVITEWTDPILYSCQKNFVLGIGDTNTHADKNLPGNLTAYRNGEPGAALTEPTPAGNVVPLNVLEATNKVGVLEYGNTSSTIGNVNQYNSDNNSAYIAGMAYLFHTTDFRADMPGARISTYWLDVLEGGDYKGGTSGRNQFYLATKYGGFDVPVNYSYIGNTTPLPASSWATTTDTIPIPNAGGPRPDNYFVANQADVMVKGLQTAFRKIDAEGSAPAYGTAFSNVLPQVTSAGNASYSTMYKPATWNGEVTANELTFDASGIPTVVTPAKWTFSARLASQLGANGWDTKRRVVTWNGSTGVPFRSANLSASDLLLLTTSTANDDGADFLNYLRGDVSNEAGCSTACGTRKAYRTRSTLVGDIVGSKAVPVGAPSWPYADATNPGYSTFKSTWARRRTAVYVGANDGMLHAINGALVSTATTNPPLEADTNYGNEMFAYVPRALFQGPKGDPRGTGLASLAKNKDFVHHYMVNASPAIIDIDLARTPDATTGRSPTNSPMPDWRSLLIGGLGKGGKAYYAIDVTDPVSMSASEGAAAGKVMWEFSNANPQVSNRLGYTFGEPMLLKTRKFGWVAVFTSGYNNEDGIGYFFFVHPRTGALLETRSTGVGSKTQDAGLAHANAFVLDSTDGTADAIYAGDLLGNVWRLDVTASSGDYPAPVKMAQLTDATSTPQNPKPQPITTRPSVEVHPSTGKRFVMVGTGRLLDESDLASAQTQSLYFIADGSNARFNPDGSPLTLPYTRSVMANDSNPLVGVSFNPSTQAGYYIDLTDSYRVISDATTVAGTVAFAGTLPNRSVCNPAGTSRVYANDFGTGLTTLQAQNGSGALTPQIYVSQTGVVSDLRFLSVGGKAVLLSGSGDTGTVAKIATTPLGIPVLRRLNWRELPVVQ